jgi:hypothetical protein
VTSRVNARIYRAAYHGLSGATFGLERRRMEGEHLKKQFPDFAHIIHKAMLHAIEDYLPPALEKKIKACTTADEIMGLF